MKPLTNDVRTKIQKYIKNNIDISDLIQGYILKGEDLTGAIITKLVRVKEDLSGCKFTRAIIGKEGEEINLSASDLRGCSFKGTKFLGILNLRKADLRRADLTECWMPFSRWEYADFRGCNFCDVTITLGSVRMRGAIFDKEFLMRFGKVLNVEFIISDKEPIDE